MKRRDLRGFGVVAALALIGVPLSAGEMSPADVFGKLQSMEGTWIVRGEPVGGEQEAPEEGQGSFEFRNSANDSAVMEIMHPGTQMEMINMYHMDGDDLMVTHYCAGGNQPVMRLDTAALAEGRIEFAFEGGTNLDPAVDQHIHSMSIEFNDDGSVASSWSGWSGGEPAGVMRFDLSRGD